MTCQQGKLTPPSLLIPPLMFSGVRLPCLDFLLLIGLMTLITIRYLHIYIILDDAFGMQCSLYCQNGMMFTTYDQDNDGSDKSCADIYKGAWWFNDCFKCCFLCEKMQWWDESDLVTLHQSTMMITDNKT